MSFLHVWFTISFPFTVLWHDLDLKHQNYLQRNISEEFHYQYISLIIYSEIRNKHNGMTFKEILSPLAEHFKHIAKQCSQVQDGSKLSQHLAVPCGKIMIQHEHSFPLHYEWTIHMWQSTILNVSLFEINIPLFDYQCVSNFLLLTEPAADGVSLKQIAKLCGRSRDKIFYSTRNTLTVELETIAGYEDISQLLLFQYQGMSQKALSFVEIRPKQVFQSSNFNLQLLHFVSYSSDFVYFLNTQLSKRFLITMPNSSTECDALVYDGPSTKSPLLKTSISHQGRHQYKSTLYFISVYFNNIITSYVKTDCLDVDILSKDTTKPRKLLITPDESLNVSLRFDVMKRNIYHKLEFETSSKNVNIKLHPFKYRGSNEAGCYLGGIMFFSSSKRNKVYGPFCGELGQNFLSGNGLSLDPQPVTMIIYLFADRLHSQMMSLGLNVKTEPCIGIINPRNIKTPQKSDGITINKHGKVILISIDFNNNQNDASLCYYIQLFLETYQDNANLLLMMSGTMEETLQVTVNMYYDRYQAQRCINCTKSNMKIDLSDYNDNITRNKNQRLSAREEIIKFNGSAQTFYFAYSMTPSVVDESFLITISPQNLHDCTCNDLGTLQNGSEPSEMTSYLIRGWCSSVTLQFKAGNHHIVYSIYPHSTLSVHLIFQNPNACHSNTYVPALVMSILAKETAEILYILSWLVYERTLDWTIVNISEDQEELRISIHIAGKDREGPVVQKDLFWFPKKYIVRLNRPVECQELLYVQIQYEMVHSQEHSLLKRGTTPKTDCIHSSCYYLYDVEHISWTDAFDICHQQGQHLVTIKSDFEAKVIKSLYFSPVLFLNLKKSDKVCI